MTKPMGQSSINSDQIRTGPEDEKILSDCLNSYVSQHNLDKLPSDGINISQEYKQMAPKMLSNEFEALKESIKQNGQYYSIVVNQDNTLLDGHHRYEICKILGIKPRIEVKSFDDKLHEKLFIYESAGKRRNLNQWQKIKLALSAEKVLKEIANQNKLANLKQNQSRNRKQLPSRSNELVGDVAVAVSKSAGLSPATFKRGKVIYEKGTEEQKNKLISGRTSINREYNTIRRLETKRQLLEETKNHKLPFSGPFNLINGDFKTASSQIPDNSVDLILTDPPYDKESLPLYKELALLARRTLKPGGSIICFYGDRLHGEFVKYLEGDAGLKENCSLHVKLQGAFARDYEKGIVRKQKPMLWYYKGPNRQKTGDLLEDLIESETPEKSLHPWQQSHIEAEKIISRLTVENQVIFDPMMGSGTNGIAALKLNRRFIGIEVDPETFATAQSNIGNAMSDTSSVHPPNPSSLP